MTAGGWVPSARWVRGLDIAAVVAVVVFVGLGVLVGVEIGRLAGLIDGSAATASSALDQLGRSVSGLAGLPLVGPQLGPLGDGVTGAATEVRVTAAAAGSALRTLAVLLGVVVATLMTPLVAAYLVVRVSRARSLRDLRRAFAVGAGPDPTLVAFLAHAAAARLPYQRLREVSVDPWADLAAGRHHRLAAAELRRLGVAAPAAWTSPEPVRP